MTAVPCPRCKTPIPVTALSCMVCKVAACLPTAQPVQQPSQHDQYCESCIVVDISMCATSDRDPEVAHVYRRTDELGHVSAGVTLLDSEGEPTPCRNGSRHWITALEAAFLDLMGSGT